MDTSIKKRILITEDEDFDLDKWLLGDTSGAKLSPSPPPPSPPSPPSSSADATAAAIPILALEEGGDDDHDVEEGEGGLGHWMLPPPAIRGDYINNSLHRVPSKSILKKTSSYSTFDLSCSRGDGGSSRGMVRKPSFQAGMDASSSNKSQCSDSRRNRCRVASSHSIDMSQASYSSQQDIGLDLDDSNPRFSPPRSPGANKFINSESSPMVSHTAAGDNAHAPDANCAAGIDSSCSRHSGSSSSNRMRRNSVSFHSVDVREYDRIVGDHPSCRSGPPLSLDWSYSKKYEKNLDEFELERSNERVDKSNLHMNKYKRRNLLAHQWGHSEEELKEARRSTKKMQRQRSMTQVLLPVHLAEEVLIGMKNLMKKKKRGGNTETDYWSDLSNSASKSGEVRTRGALPRQDTVGQNLK